MNDEVNLGAEAPACPNAIPASLDEAHLQLVGLDVALDEYRVDVDALTVDEALASIDAAKAILARVLQFTSTATGLPA